MVDSRRRRRPRPPTPYAVWQPGPLESLPLELLNEILARLPLRCAVRTSVLARSWRRRWESVPSLLFEWNATVEPIAISHVLRRYSCPVHEFLHRNIRKASFQESDRWFRLLALRRVETLHLNFQRLEGFVHTLHPSIFSCQGLTILVLYDCNMPTMHPDFAGFPNLKHLSLQDIGFPGPPELEALIAASPLLEKLTLTYLMVPFIDQEEHQWAIQAPKLRYLSIDELVDSGWQICDLPSLEEAEINIAYYSFHRDFVKLTTALAHAKKLKLVIPNGNANVLEGLSCHFDNLKNLSLRISLSLLPGALSLFCMLRNSPKLEVLDIKLYDYASEDDEIDSDFLDAQWTDDLFTNFIRVGVTHVTCKLSEMLFIQFVLSKARQLGELHVCLDEDCPISNEDAVTELVKYRRASPRAKIFFSRSDDDD